MGRMMSIDYGDKRVGIALSDPMHTISYPLCVINQVNQNQLINDILKIINEKQVEKIIIGLPISMSGSYSSQTKKVILFKGIFESFSFFASSLTSFNNSKSSTVGSSINDFFII